MESTLNYYDILSIPRDATAEQIKKAFRLLAMKYHPDVCKSNDDRAIKRINEAYSILSDSEKRAKYDHELGTTRSKRSSSKSTSERNNSDYSNMNNRKTKGESRKEELELMLKLAIMRVYVEWNSKEIEQLIFEDDIPDYYDIFCLDPMFKKELIIELLNKNFKQFSTRKKRCFNEENEELKQKYEVCCKKIKEAITTFEDKHVYDAALLLNEYIYIGRFDDLSFNAFNESLLKVEVLNDQTGNNISWKERLEKAFISRMVEVSKASLFDPEIPDYYKIFRIPTSFKKECILEIIKFAKESYKRKALRVNCKESREDKLILDALNDAELLINHKEKYEFAMKKSREIDLGEYQYTDFRLFSSELISGGRLVGEPKILDTLREKLNLLYVTKNSVREIGRNIPKSQIIEQLGIINKIQELYLEGVISSLENVKLGKIPELSNNIVAISDGNKLIDVYFAHNYTRRDDNGKEFVEVTNMLFKYSKKDKSFTKLLEIIDFTKREDNKNRIRDILDKLYNIKKPFISIFWNHPHKYLMNRQFPNHIFIIHEELGLRVHRVEKVGEGIRLFDVEINWQ